MSLYLDLSSEESLSLINDRATSIKIRDENVKKSKFKLLAN